MPSGGYSLVASHCNGFSSCGALAVGCKGLVALWHVGSSQIRNWNCVSCIGRQILYHGATREAPGMDGFYLKIWHFGEKSKHSLAQRGAWGGRGKTQAEEVDFSFQSLLDGHRALPTGSPSTKIHHASQGRQCSALPPHWIFSAADCLGLRIESPLYSCHHLSSNPWWGNLGPSQGWMTSTQCLVAFQPSDYSPSGAANGPGPDRGPWVLNGICLSGSLGNLRALECAADRLCRKTHLKVPPTSVCRQDSWYDLMQNDLVAAYKSPQLQRNLHGNTIFPEHRVVGAPRLEPAWSGGKTYGWHR